MVNPVTPESTAAFGVQARRPDATASLDDLIRERVDESRRRIGEAPTSVRDTGVTFVPRPDLGLIQARVIDRSKNEVVKEIPPAQKLEFASRFRRALAETVGRRLDLEA